MIDAHRVEGFISLITDIFCQLLFYSDHCHSTCGAQQSPSFNLLVSIQQKSRLQNANEAYKKEALIL